MRHEPTCIDLFTGCGGMAIASEWAGFRTIAHSEVDPFCCRLLAQRWPDIQNLGDVTKFEQWPDFGPVSIVQGGPPCQPFSIAGRRQGEADHRNLWPSMLGVIRRYRPDWCLVENVVNAGNMVLASWQDDLEAAGYSSQAFDLPSCAVGLPTMERHIWIVAAANVSRLERLSEVGVSRQHGKLQKRNGRAPDDGITGYAELATLPEPKLIRSRKGVANFVDRIKAIGNAVPPPVAYQILKAIREQIA